MLPEGPEILERKGRVLTRTPQGTAAHLAWCALSTPLSTTDWAKQRVSEGSPHADSGVHGVAPPSCTRVSGRDWLETKGKGIAAAATTTYG